MEKQNVSDKFNLWKKWFWIGMVIGFFDLLTGLVFGIALVSEKEHRKEGITIIIFSLICFLLKNFVIAPWLIKAGYVPEYRLMNVNVNK